MLAARYAASAQGLPPLGITAGSSAHALGVGKSSLPPADAATFHCWHEAAVSTREADTGLFADVGDTVPAAAAPVEPSTSTTTPSVVSLSSGGVDVVGPGGAVGTGCIVGSLGTIATVDDIDAVR